jgi:hypothetical protein
MRVTAGAFAFLAFALAAYPQSQDDKLLQASLRRFNEEFYRISAGDDEKIAALKELAQYRHERVARTLGPLLLKSSLPVRIVTARELAKFQNVPGAPEALLGGLRARENAGKKTAPVRIEALRGLGSLKARDAAGDVDALVEDKDVWIAKAAIDASAQLRVKTSIDPLLKSLRRIEGPDGNHEISVDPLADALPPTTVAGIIKSEVVKDMRPKSERDLLRDPILKALRSITRHEATFAKDWESWWEKNRRTFKVAD